jgi:hypothetical protein
LKEAAKFEPALPNTTDARRSFGRLFTKLHSESGFHGEEAADATVTSNTTTHPTNTTTTSPPTRTT